MIIDNHDSRPPEVGREKEKERETYLHGMYKGYVTKDTVIS